MKYRADIDGLRSLAVVPVVVFHAEKSIMPGGYIGVDIFFVISGYLISLILMTDLSEQRFSLLTFYERRARRILPSLLLVLTATLAVAYFIIGPEQYVRLARSALATITFSSNIWFWFKQGDYFAASSETEALLHTWSLAVEEQFYLFYPLLLAIFIRLRWRPLPLIAVLSAASFALSVWGVENNPRATFYLIPTRAWELGLGCTVAILAYSGHLRLNSPKAAMALGAAGIILIVIPLFLYTPLTPFPGISALPPCLGAALLITAGTIERNNPVSRFLALEPLRQIGLISYSLYLWHWPIMAFARVVTGTNELPLAVASSTVVLSFALAWLTTYSLESVFRSRDKTSQTAVVALSVVGIAVVAVSSFSVIRATGIPSRMTERELQILDTARFDITALPNRCDSSSAPSDSGCRLGNDDGGSPEFMLWGDSHAGSLSPAIDKLALANNRRGVLSWMVGCPPAIGIYTSGPGNKAACPRQNNQTLLYLESHPSIKVVILHARWALYATGSYPERNDAKLHLFSSAHSAVNASTDEEKLRVSLDETIAAIRALGREVVIIEGVPELNFDLLSALYASEAFGARPVSGPPRTAVTERNTSASDVMGKIADGRGARVVSVVDDLCKETCLVEYEGEPVYRDTNHLSTKVAQSLVFEALVQKNLFDFQ